MSIAPLLLPNSLAQPASDNTFRWATVTQVAPLRIRLDGDTAELPFTPESLIQATLPLGTRVWVQLYGRRLIIMGTGQSGGPDAWMQFSGDDVIATSSGDFNLTLGKILTDGRWALLEVNVQRLNTTLASSASGNIVNTSMGFLKPEWAAADTSLLVSSGSGQICHGYYDANAQLVISAMLPNVDWAVAGTISFQSVFPLKTPLKPTWSPDPIPGGPSPYASWQAPVLLNGWTIYGSGWNPPGYRQDSTGRVWLHGLVKSGTVGLSTPIFYVPQVLAPDGTATTGELFIVPANGGAFTARLDVTNDGRVAVNALGTGATNGYLSLNNVSWMLAGL